ncbi:rab-GTPase-TBC domain-containing protein [Xylariales sp. AK1849]|nr:rab-GTPase-TBC domain-containing protein [Xylariales sp. AK1849]
MTHDEPHFGAVDMMHTIVPSPGSPPGMSSSKSSKTSSLQSFGSDDDNSVLADAGHFEEIGLDDDTITVDTAHSRDITQAKSSPNPYSSSFTSDLRAQSTRHVGPNIHPAHSSNNRDLARPRPQRDITATQKSRPKFPPAIRTQFRDTSTQNLNSIGPQRHTSPLPIRALSTRSASSISSSRRRHRSPSPNLSLRSLSPRDPSVAPKPRRSSWQSTLERKTAADLEKECDEDEDDIPEGFILDNVPISPRPPRERAASHPASASTSPERLSKEPKERVRSVGNGTPPVAVAQGSLRSPSWRSEASSVDLVRSPGIGPPLLKGRAKSWNEALSALSAEAKALTEKLEEHADEQDKNGIHGNSSARSGPKLRVKSALAELPPLRRTNIMIDPLPISKEKEAVLSRTRPSWLPPKDPAEEKKHLKEYQKLIASSIEADKRREAARREKEKSRDAMASNWARIWEQDVLQRWNEAIRERRTRELWWKGIAPRTRGAVWTQAIGNELGLTETSFQAALTRSHEIEARVAEGSASLEDERKANWFKQIRSDVEGKTWGELKIFQHGGPLHQLLVDVLCAYAMYRSDIGYVTGCNTIAAILLLNLPSATLAFITLANMLNRPLPLSFYASDSGAKASAYNLLLQTLATKAPHLHKHLTSPGLGLAPEEYLFDVFTALFTPNLSLDECTRLWDVYVFEGDSVLVRAAIALLMDREGALLAANNCPEIIKALSKSGQETTQGREDQWMSRVRDAGKA